MTSNSYETPISRGDQETSTASSKVSGRCYNNMATLIGTLLLNLCRSHTLKHLLRRPFQPASGQ